MTPPAKKRRGQDEAEAEAEMWGEALRAVYARFGGADKTVSYVKHVPGVGHIVSVHGYGPIVTVCASRYGSSDFVRCRADRDGFAPFWMGRSFGPRYSQRPLYADVLPGHAYGRPFDAGCAPPGFALAEMDYVAWVCLTASPPDRAAAEEEAGRKDGALKALRDYLGSDRPPRDGLVCFGGPPHVSYDAYVPGAGHLFTVQGPSAGLYSVVVTRAGSREHLEHDEPGEEYRPPWFGRTCETQYCTRNPFYAYWDGHHMTEVDCVADSCFRNTPPS